MKFALTFALSHHAQLLNMDEPTSELDPLVKNQLLGILSKYMEEDGKGVIYASHITSDLDKLADIPVFIHKGEIVFVEDKDHLLESHRIVKGGKKYLMKENKSLFINLDVTDYSFTGVINQVDSSKKSIPDMVQERLNVEYLMMAYTEGRQ